MPWICGRQRGMEGSGVPGWASKAPLKPRPMVESALTPKIPPEKARKHTQDLVVTLQ